MRGHCCRTAAGRPFGWLLLLSAIGVGCGGNEPPREQPARPVKTMIIAAGDETHTRSFPGKVNAARKAELAFQVSGLLERLPVKEGQRVARGEVIAELRLDEFQARLKALQAKLDQARAALRGLQAGERPEQQRRLETQVRAARARLENTQIEYERNSYLLKLGGASQRDVDRSKAQYAVAQEDHKAAQEAARKGNHRADGRHRGTRSRGEGPRGAGGGN